MVIILPTFSVDNVTFPFKPGTPGIPTSFFNPHRCFFKLFPPLFPRKPRVAWVQNGRELGGIRCQSRQNSFLWGEFWRVITFRRSVSGWCFFFEIFYWVSWLFEKQYIVYRGWIWCRVMNSISKNRRTLGSCSLIHPQNWLAMMPCSVWILQDWFWIS